MKKVDGFETIFYYRSERLYQPPIESSPNKNGESSPEPIVECWKKHVKPFVIKHGTSSLYLKHFQKHGISSSYPEPLHDLITKIRKVWGDHESDVMAKTNYFQWFEERYDTAQKDKRVSVSFTADEFRTQEYTTGARGYGGEWMREVRNFLREANYKKIAFTQDEKKIIDEMEAFDAVLYKAPPMMINLRGGSSALAKILHRTDLLPLDDFVARIKEKCPKWQDEAQLKKYLNDIFLPELKTEINKYQKNYEITVPIPIDPKELDFQILDESLPLSKEYPKLSFNTPTKLSATEVNQLRIRGTLYMSEREMYRDSKFELKYNWDKDNTTIITRIKLTEKDQERIQLQQQWLKAFDCKIGS